MRAVLAHLLWEDEAELKSNAGMRHKTTYETSAGMRTGFMLTYSDALLVNVSAL